MRQRKYTLLERHQIEAAILFILKRQPMPAITIAAQLGLSDYAIRWFLAELARKQQVKKLAWSHKETLWYLTDHPPAPPRIKDDPWIDEEHQRWMDYWRKPKAQRAMIRE